MDTTGISTANDAVAVDPVEEVVARALKLARRGRDGVLQARQLLEDRLRADPHDYRPLDAEAEILTNSGAAPLAEKLLDEYILYYPDTPDASARLAWVYWQDGRRDEALAELRANLVRNPSHRRSRIQCVQWLGVMGEWEKAVALANEGLELHPGDSTLLLELGIAELHRGEFPRAEEHLRAALVAKPGDARATRELALLLTRRRRHDEAFALIEPIASTERPSLDTLLAAAEVSFHATKMARCLDFLAEATRSRVRYPPQHARTVDAIFRYLRKEDALKFCFSQLEIHGVSDSFAQALLIRLIAEQDKSSTVRVIRTLLQHPSHFGGALCLLFRAHGELIPDAEVDRFISTQAASIHQSTPLWGAIGQWFQEKGRPEDAIRILADWRQRRDVEPWILLAYGKAMESLSRWAEANDAYRAALRLEPDRFEATLRLRLGWNLAMDGFPGAGFLIAKDLSTPVEDNTGVEDRLRLLTIVALAQASRIRGAAEMQAIFTDAVSQMRAQAAKPVGEAGRLIQAFRTRASELLQAERSRESGAEPEAGIP